MSSYYSNVRHEIEALLPHDFSTVMDIGCGNGATSEWLKSKKSDTFIIGIEYNEDEASAAELKLDKVQVSDLNSEMPKIDQYLGKVDLLLMLDILEHLQDPWSRLKSFRAVLSPQGIVIASIPNIRNMKVLIPLIFRGKWTYESAGILDRTHLRFFTRNSILELFENAGFAVDTIKATGPLRAGDIKSISGAFVYTLNLLTFGLLQGFFAHQYIVSARIGD